MHLRKREVGQGRREKEGDRRQERRWGTERLIKKTTRPESLWSSKARKISAFPRTGDRKRGMAVGSSSKAGGNRRQAETLERQDNVLVAEQDNLL